MPTRVLIALVAVLTLATTGCGGSDDPPAADGTDRATTTAAEGEAGEGGEGADDGAEGSAGGGGFGTCEDVDQATLDLLEPGLAPTEGSDIPVAALNCSWEVAKGDGTVFLSVQGYEGKQYHGREAFGDEVELTDVDLCDDAFVYESLGLSLQVLDGERAYIFGATQTLVDEDQRTSVEEGKKRLTALAAAVTGC